MGQVSFQEPKTLTGNADADYSTKQYYLMDYEATTGNVKLVAAAGARCVGVLLDKVAAADRPCLIAVGGIVPCVAGTGGVAAGDLICASAAGKGIVATRAYTDTQAGSATDALIGSFVIGRALTAAAEDEQFRLHIQPVGAVAVTDI